MNFLLAAVAAFELQLPIVCGPTGPLLDGLNNRYNEEIIFMSPSKNADGESLTHSFWVNTQNQTWTFIVTNKEKESTCVIASGDNFWLVTPQEI